MDENQMNSFEGNSNASAGANSGVSDNTSSNPSAIPVNPYAPSGAPYAPGSNTPAPSYAAPSQSTPYTARTWNSPAISPAVPNTAGNDTFMSIAPAPKETKFFTKKFVIFLIIGLILIAAAIVTGVVIKNNRSNTPAQNTSNASFNSYMNYILLGVQSDSAYTAGYSPSDIYYIETVFNSNNNYDVAVAKAFASKWDVFYNLLDNNQKGNSAVSEYNSLIALFKSYTEAPTLTDDALLTAYSNTQGNVSYLTDYYLPYTNSSSSYAKSYGELLVQYGTAVFNKYAIYSRGGCIIEGQINQECVDILELSDDDRVKIAEPNKLLLSARNAFAEDTGLLITKVWDVNTVINGGAQS
ncbi:hypothetical protein IJ114_02360 [Candidatus Saccharibacteria bacterium]|nr:hypothetical protein [Candidatus Saccharibacteria bacterium]